MYVIGARLIDIDTRKSSRPGRTISAPQNKRSSPLKEVLITFSKQKRSQFLAKTKWIYIIEVTNASILLPGIYWN